MGTLSKALGSEGGFVCGSRLLIDYLRNVSRPFIFSTSPGAPAMAAATAAIEVLEAEPGRVTRLQGNVKIFVEELAAHGVKAASASAIVPILVGDEKAALAAKREQAAQIAPEPPKAEPPKAEPPKDDAQVETYRLKITGTREALTKLREYGESLGISFKKITD